MISGREESPSKWDVYDPAVWNPRLAKFMGWRPGITHYWKGDRRVSKIDEWLPSEDPSIAPYIISEINSKVIKAGGSFEITVATEPPAAVNLMDKIRVEVRITIPTPSGYPVYHHGTSVGSDYTRVLYEAYCSAVEFLEKHGINTKEKAGD